MTTPTQLSLASYRKAGYTCQVVEHFNSFARRRQDLFGFIDIVAICEEQLGVLGIQTTSKSNISARILKIKKEPVAKTWLMGGNMIVVEGWGKNKAGRYEVVRYNVTLDNINIWE